jgi:hypothetical protein
MRMNRCGVATLASRRVGDRSRVCERCDRRVAGEGERDGNDQRAVAIEYAWSEPYRLESVEDLTIGWTKVGSGGRRVQKRRLVAVAPDEMTPGEMLP